MNLYWNSAPTLSSMSAWILALSINPYIFVLQFKNQSLILCHLVLQPRSSLGLTGLLLQDYKLWILAPLWTRVHEGPLAPARNCGEEGLLQPYSGFRLSTWSRWARKIYGHGSWAICKQFVTLNSGTLSYLCCVYFIGVEQEEAGAEGDWRKATQVKNEPSQTGLRKRDV